MICNNLQREREAKGGVEFCKAKEVEEHVAHRSQGPRCREAGGETRPQGPGQSWAQGGNRGLCARPAWCACALETLSQGLEAQCTSNKNMDVSLENSWAIWFLKKLLTKLLHGFSKKIYIYLLFPAKGQ